MKPSFESAKHQAILAQRLQDQAAARLGQITGDKAARILSNTLTGAEQENRRYAAGALQYPGKIGPWRQVSAEELRDMHPDHILGE